jgi:hypothetical protein
MRHPALARRDGRPHDPSHVNRGGSFEMEVVMKGMVIGLSLAVCLVPAMIPGVASAMAVRAPAQGHHWCAVYSNGSENCGFATHAQCMSTVNGSSGFCRMT